MIQAIVAKDPTFLRYNDAHLPLNRLTELESLRELRFGGLLIGPLAGTAQS